MFTMMCKAAPFEKLACMIDADTVAARHVSGSLQLGRSLHEMVILSMLGESYVGAAQWHANGMLRVESWKLSLLECLDLSIVRLRCTGDQRCKRLRPTRSADARDQVILKNPALYCCDARTADRRTRDHHGPPLLT